jgi:hypothetical protein
VSKKKYPGKIEGEKRLVFLRMRAQAVYRDEEWAITWEQFQKIWPDDLWDQRGRSSNCLVLTRKDLDGPWVKHNVHIIQRAQQLSKMSSRPRKPKKLKGIIYDEQEYNV